MSDHVKEIKDVDFEKEVLESEIPVLVDFWAPWCGPCKAIAPTLDEIAKEFTGKIKIVKINVDEESKFAAQYGVRSIPNLNLFANGKLVETKMGSQPKSELISWLTPHFNSAAK
jgi:thioredoxin 1